jgi:16S rRNA (uracil1498-N3)-methyltransferase
MQLFFTTESVENDIITLDKEESYHLAKVLRIRENEKVYLTNGKGSLCTCVVLEANDKRSSLQIIDTHKDFGKRDYKIHLAIAPLKNMDRMEFLIEKAIELGVDEISPILTEHTERKVVKTERLEKIILSAMKQSLTCFAPKLNEMRKITALLETMNEKKCYMCCCGEGEKIYIKDDYQKGEDAIIFIGPEGDFSEKEVLMAQNSNCKLITLGDKRLRTETAALYAISNIHFLNQ